MDVGWTELLYTALWTQIVLVNVYWTELLYTALWTQIVLVNVYWTELLYTALWTQIVLVNVYWTELLYTALWTQITFKMTANGQVVGDWATLEAYNIQTHTAQQSLSNSPVHVSRLASAWKQNLTWLTSMTWSEIGYPHPSQCFCLHKWRAMVWRWTAGVEVSVLVFQHAADPSITHLSHTHCMQQPPPYNISLL